MRFPVGPPGGVLHPMGRVTREGCLKRTSYEFSSSLVCKRVSAHYTRTVGHKLLLSDFLICFFGFLVCTDQLRVRGGPERLPIVF